MKLQFNMQELQFSLSNKHPNIMEWSGVICKIAQASDGAPGGANGKRVVFTQDAVMKHYGTFAGQPLNVVWPDGMFDSPSETLNGHGDDIIGYMSQAWPDGDNLMGKGTIWKSTFSDISNLIVKGQSSLGFSIEAYIDKCHEDETDGFLYVDDFVGCGVAMLWKDSCAFSSTELQQLVASKQKKEVDSMTKEELQALIADSLVEFGKIVDQKVEVITASVNEQMEQLACGLVEAKDLIKAQREEIASEALDALKAEKEAVDAKVTELEAEVEQLKAPTEPQRLTSQFASVVTKFQEIKKDEIKDIVASDKSSVDKIASILSAKFSKAK